MLLREILGWILYHWQRLFHRLPQVSSVYFHDPSPAVFESVVKWHVKHHYRFIGLNELDALIQSKQQPKERLAFVSFDDGWKNNVDLLPLCEQYQIPITIFIATEAIDSGNFWWEYVTKRYDRNTMLEFKKKPQDIFVSDLEAIKSQVQLERSALTLQQLNELNKHPLVSLQSHTVNHFVLTNTTDEQLEYELTTSKLQLENITGKNITWFSYPNGNVTEREIQALRKTGYRYAFTTQAFEFNAETVNPYLIPRRAINTHGGKFENWAKILGIWYRIIPVK